MSDDVRVREVKSNESSIQARCKLNNLLHYLPHLGCILGDHDAHDAWPGRPRPYGAISNANNEHYHAMTQALAERAGLPMPRVYVIESPQPNAFATGRNPQNAAVAVNTGLVDILNERELVGVIAHELAHIKNRDTLIMTVTATIAGAISMIANFGVLFGGGNREGQPGNPLLGCSSLSSRRSSWPAQ